ncbi:MAG: ComEC/Rec2 family competence protein [Nocardioides sp.]|uniref:ComEC/Rec2 family competence protein n=1 Tax=Nocardioides sp. TaxID=35761 RepID=UPI0039E42E56
MRDLRLPLLGVAAWIGALLGPQVAAWPVGGGIVASIVLVLGAALGRSIGRSRRRRDEPSVASSASRRTAAALLIMALGAGAVAGLRAAQVQHNPVADLAAHGARVHLTASVSSDARSVIGVSGEHVLITLRVTDLTGRGQHFRLGAPVLAIGDSEWAEVPLGATVVTSGRLVTADESDVAALLVADTPRLVAGPGPWWRAAGAVRSAIRAAVADRPADQRALVPALVDGDDTGLADDLADDFRTTGLTHLLAVSGTNLTLLVGFALIVARWCGVRGRWLYLVGAGGIVGFVLLARTEPSVVRAAAMGTVGLLAMARGGRGRALRGLGAAVCALMLLDPGLATSLGFALSALATAGILLFGPPWRDALCHWLPRWAAEAIAVPAAAQLACTPLIAAISGQVSLVAVLANLLAEPAVAPATVLGLLAGVCGLVSAPLGRLVATPAGWCVGWIIAVARHCAHLPTPAIGWGSGPVALALLVLGCVAVVGLGPRLLRRPLLGVGCALLLTLVLLVRMSRFGWPPDDWVMVMCDIGQGDGLVVSAGDHAAIVVDSGPAPEPMDRCLDDLGITTVPLLVFTHFDADHVTGASGVFSGRRVGAVWTTTLYQPASGVDKVTDAAADAGVEPTPAPYAATGRIGPVELQVLWPSGALPAGTDTNGSSVVLLVRSHGLTLLLTGDVDPDGQRVLASRLPGLTVDVLKVPHHGSKYQDEDWLLSLHARVALTSVGADNDYGHPAASTLDPLAAAGTAVYRTDTDGAIAVLGGAAGPRVVTD